jgi:hypothetical protein
MIGSVIGALSEITDLNLALEKADVTARTQRLVE